MCEYNRQRGVFLNAGGHLPCRECNECRQLERDLERNRRWNEATDRGAKPNR